MSDLENQDPSSQPSKAEKDSLQKVIDYKKVFGSEEGQRVLLDMMQSHGMLTPSFNPNPYELSRLAGERNVLCRILSLMGVDIANLKSLMTERRLQNVADS